MLCYIKINVVSYTNRRMHKSTAAARELNAEEIFEPEKEGVREGGKNLKSHA